MVTSIQGTVHISSLKETPLRDFRDVFPGIPIVESPLFPAVITELGLSSEERRIGADLHERGYAVMDFPDDELDARIHRIIDDLAPQYGIDFSNVDSVKNSGQVQRLQDAWTYHQDVRAIAANEHVTKLLGKLYGRRAFAFQTLNFPVGTQQHLHSDSIHFSSVPERFMCGVWLAMEDISADAGPLTYLPGSHGWPIVTNAMIGRRGYSNRGELAQRPFEAAWEALVASSGIEAETFAARKGQALIWAANLLHGGSPQNDPTLTRWSQVTHYYFDDCSYYTPAFSDEALGNLDLRTVIDVKTEELKPNVYLGERLDAEPVHDVSVRSRLRTLFRSYAGLPKDFDPDAYHRLNPDVAAAKLDPAMHYLKHGKAEGRRYRYR